MAKIALFNDFPEYAEMIAAPLRGAGHEVLIELVPIDFNRVLHFGPQVISVALYRKEQAFDRPIRNPIDDIMGYTSLLQMESYPAVEVIPILLTGNAVQEKDVPTGLNYDAFLVFPGDIQKLLPTIEHLAKKQKTRRKISGYVCPKCGGRLVFTTSEKDLFCPRCHTAVAVVGNEGCMFMTPDGQQESCTLDQLIPPALKTQP